MQKIYNLDKWFGLKEGEKLTLKAGKPRRVRLEVNAPMEARLYCSLGGGAAMFLANVIGRDLVEFFTAAELQTDIYVETENEGGMIFVYTVDGIDVSAKSDGSESFVRIIERKPRNHEAELMAYRMQENMQRMLNAQASELERVIERRLAAQRALAAPEGAAPGAGKKSASDGNGKQPDTKPAKADGGSEGKPAEGKPDPGRQSDT